MSRCQRKRRTGDCASPEPVCYLLAVAYEPPWRHPPQSQSLTLTAPESNLYGALWPPFAQSAGGNADRTKQNDCEIVENDIRSRKRIKPRKESVIGTKYHPPPYAAENQPENAQRGEQVFTGFFSLRILVMGSPQVVLGRQKRQRAIKRMISFSLSAGSSIRVCAQSWICRQSQNCVSAGLEGKWRPGTYVRPESTT